MKRLICLMAVVLLSACAALNPFFDKPEVELTSIQILPSSGYQQGLQLGVRVTNPNNFALDIGRLKYSISLEGREIATGTYREKLEIPADDSVSFTVPVELNLLGGWAMLQTLLRSPKAEIDYRMDAEADISTLGIGKVKVSRSETIPLVP